ncbi:MAG: amidohydrolase family protein [Deferrisomatales bacterium]|nr:amidohydrolase family protein [Deferrisomatales bacterium]
MFIMDCECHMLPPADDIKYFPLYQRNQTAVRNIVQRLEPYAMYGVREIQGLKDTRAVRKRRASPDPEESATALVEKMDESGVAMACVLPESMLATSFGARMQSTNGWLAKGLAKYPDRLLGVCNVGPVIARGVKNAIWELEHLVKEMNFKAVKSYPVDDTPINNRELWPFYEKIQELGIPLFLHSGYSWCIPGRSANAMPWLLEDVCEDFPDLTILAYHMGYPFTDQLNMLAMKYENLYIGTSLLPYFGHGAGRRAQVLLAEAFMYAGSDKMVWGTDFAANKDEVLILKNIQISEQVQEEFGYHPITEEDRAKWAGLNLARILKITPPQAKTAL